MGPMPNRSKSKRLARTRRLNAASERTLNVQNLENDSEVRCVLAAIHLLYPITS